MRDDSGVTPKLLAKISFMTLMFGLFLGMMRPDGPGDAGWDIGYILFRVGAGGLLAAAIWAGVMYVDRPRSRAIGPTQKN